MEPVAGGSPFEHLALRSWAGHGAVRLLRADPRRGALLTEHTDPGADLHRLPAPQACAVTAAVMVSLHRPAVAQPPTLPDLVPGWVDELERLADTGLVPRRFVDQARRWAVELSAAPGSGATLLPGDLHSGTVRRGARVPWLAVAPRPLGGEPGFEVAPLLAHRWADAVATGDLRAALRERFFLVVDRAGLDEDRTRAWVCVRVMAELALAVREGRADPDRVTRAVILVKAMQG